MFNSVVQCFTKKYFQFKGRASRKEYNCYILFCWLIGVFAEIITNNIYNVIIYERIFFICTFIPLIAVTTRRLHDFNINGIVGVIVFSIWVSLLFFKGYNATFIITGLLITLVLMSLKGTPGSNKYGELPVD